MDITHIGPTPRVYGTEFEYGMIVSGSESVPEHFFSYLPHGMGGSLQYRKNGSRIYPDVGHAEYATPECGTLGDMVAAELAGEEIFIATLQRLAGGNAQASYRLHKRNIDQAGNSYGAHESYCVDHSIRFDDVPSSRKNYLVQALAIHYVSRIALVGGGYYNRDTGRWRVSQRTAQLRLLTDGVCNGVERKPLVDTRNEALADLSRYRRLHVSHGDPNVSSWALRTKIGMTSAFLRLLEAGVPMEHLFLRDPLQAAYQVGADTSLSAKLELHDGRRMTALELQETIAEKILAMADTRLVPLDELAVAEEVYAASGHATKDLDALMYKTDWYTRQQLVEEKAVRSKYGGSIKDRLAGLDQMYDAIVCKLPGSEPVAGIGKRLRDEKGKFGPVDHAAVKRLQSSPPTSSRALLRGKLIQAAAVPDIKQRYGIPIVGWDYIKFSTSPELKFTLDDPTQTKPDQAMRRLFWQAGISLAA